MQLTGQVAAAGAAATWGSARTAEGKVSRQEAATTVVAGSAATCLD